MFACEIDIIETLQTIIEIICLVAATFVAVWGLNTWRSEIVGRRKIELAEDILAMFYEAQDIFIAVRMPAAFGNEGSSRPREGAETESDGNYKNSLYVPIERLQKHSEFFGKMQSLRYRFMAYFGKEAINPFNDIKKAHTDIVVSASMLIRTVNRNENREDLRKQRERWESDIGWWGEVVEDKLTPLINQAVKDIENICKPYLIDKNKA